MTGDWGDLDEEDQPVNDAALIDGSRILSAYVTRKGVRIWVITEAVNEVGLRYCDDVSSCPRSIEPSDPSRLTRPTPSNQREINNLQPERKTYD